MTALKAGFVVVNDTIVRPSKGLWGDCWGGACFHAGNPDKDNIDRLRHEEHVAISNVAAAHPCAAGSLRPDSGLKPRTEELIDSRNRVQQAIGTVALSMTSRFSMRWCVW